MIMKWLDICLLYTSKVKSTDEAIKVANDTEYGLQAGVFTENFRDGLRLSLIHI